MIATVAFTFALLADGNDPVVLKRSFVVGDVDVFRVQVSPIGQASPLSNPFDVSLKVVQGGQVIAWGAATPYEPARKLARWRENGAVLFSEKGFDFLPDLLFANDQAIRPGEIEALRGGSIKLVGAKDSVAQLRIWMPLADGTMLSEDSDVEIGSRRPNHGSGTIYRSEHGQLVAVRAFTFERIRTKGVAPIRQDGD